MGTDAAGPGLEHLPDDVREDNAALDELLKGAGASFASISEGLLARLRRRQGEGVPTVPTFLESWNRVSRGQGGGRGLAVGWYDLIAGLTGAGKTLIALNLIAEAMREGHDVLYFSLEMSWETLCTRLWAIVSGEDVRHLEPGEHYSEERAKAADAEILDLPGRCHLNLEPIWELEDIRDVMKAHRRAEGVELVVVDYAQLVSPAGSDRELFTKMSEISSQLRHAAQSLGMATVALSQLNRSSTADRGRKPTVDGLYGSSRFGFDADQVLVLDYSRRQRKDRQRRELTWINLVKNRHGPQVEIPVELDYSTLRIREALPDEEATWPGAG